MATAEELLRAVLGDDYEHEVQDGPAPGHFVHTFRRKASGLRLERCTASGDPALGLAHLCHCGQVFQAPLEAGNGPWRIPEHDGECTW